MADKTIPAVMQSRTTAARSNPAGSDPRLQPAIADVVHTQVVAELER